MRWPLPQPSPTHLRNVQGEGSPPRKKTAERELRERLDRIKRNRLALSMKYIRDSVRQRLGDDDLTVKEIPIKVNVREL